MSYTDWLGTKVASVQNVQNAPNGIVYWKEHEMPANSSYVVGGIDAEWVKDYGAEKIHFIMLECNKSLGVEYIAADEKIKINTAAGTEGTANLDVSGYKFRAYVWAEA